jgi:hypothetical protein
MPTHWDEYSGAVDATTEGTVQSAPTTLKFVPLVPLAM